jgi:hypothetical protein
VFLVGWTTNVGVASAVASLLPGHTIPLEKEGNVRRVFEPLGKITAADVTHVVEPHRLEFCDMTIGINNGVI